jgi:hypothetical protein
MTVDELLFSGLDNPVSLEVIFGSPETLENDLSEDNIISKDRTEGNFVAVDTLKLSDYIQVTITGPKKSISIINTYDGESPEKLSQYLSVLYTDSDSIKEIEYNSYWHPEDGVFEIGIFIDNSVIIADFHLMGVMTLTNEMLTFRDGIFFVSLNGNSAEFKIEYSLTANVPMPLRTDEKSVSLFDMNILELGIIAARAREIWN